MTEENNKKVKKPKKDKSEKEKKKHASKKKKIENRKLRVQSIIQYLYRLSMFMINGGLVMGEGSGGGGGGGFEVLQMWERSYVSFIGFRGYWIGVRVFW